MNKTMINIKILLSAVLIGIFIMYYLFLTIDEITKIVKNEYIFLSIVLALGAVFLFFKVKLKNSKIIEYLPNINTVDLRTSMIFFLIFQVVDFYYENGFIGMISQWFTYWVFGVIAWLLTNNINFYKNYQYKKI
jgi:hypothetical protein